MNFVFFRMCLNKNCLLTSQTEPAPFSHITPEKELYLLTCEVWPHGCRPALPDDLELRSLSGREHITHSTRPGHRQEDLEGNEELIRSNSVGN